MSIPSIDKAEFGTRGFRMKFNEFGIAMAVVSGVLFSSSTVAGDSDFTLVNKTGFTIGSVFIAPSSKKGSDWGKDAEPESVTPVQIQR